eukprot:CAMPEP_0113559128 /NCGR_PEP_ID=MMETSP0015_2-20120614/18724_1 /TAXON_ID=2838 /ORGANISM="Odontella" /LENGTH=576 /DNA_ID=CAMNT_0000460729 /DNA_START=470 /DNA_END=2197 /DNA_ORIENTATION=+ /assembly_acc=CAM_ASM_000160
MRVFSPSTKPSKALAWSQRAEKTHILHESRRSTICKFATVDGDTPNQLAQTSNPRQIMDMIRSRYDTLEYEEQEKEAGTASTWTRTQNYIFRKKRDLLSLCQVEEVLAFLEEEFGGNEQMIVKILQATPRILRKNTKTQLRPIVDFLRGLYGDDLFYEAINRNPDLLVTSGLGYDSFRNQDEDVEAFFTDRLALQTRSLQKLKQTTPFLFQLSKKKIEPVVLFLTSVFDDAGYKENESRRLVGKIITSSPHLLGLSVEANLQPTLDFLKKACGLDHFESAKVVKTFPGILGLSIKHNLSPTIDFVANVLSGRSIDDAACTSSGQKANESRKKELKKCVSKHPQLLALSISNLKMKVAFFDEIDQRSLARPDDPHPLRPSTQSLASRVVLSAPSTYSLSLHDNIMPKVGFLAETWGLKGEGLVSETDSELSKVRYHDGVYSTSKSCDICRGSLSQRLGEFPSILTLSLEGNIQPTVKFYKAAGYLGANEGQTVSPSTSILRARYIATSLYNTLLPRWDYLRQASRLPDDFEPPALHLLAAATDSKFCTDMSLDLNAYFAYRKEAIPRLKFSSQFEMW